MTRSFRIPTTFGYTAVAASLAASVALVAPISAHADTASYLDKLHRLGINTPGGGGINTPGGDIEMKEWGWEVCYLFERGVAPDKVRDQAVYNSGSGPQYGMTVEQADAIVHVATTDLCMDNK